MLRLPDARSGRYADVSPGRPGLLRVNAHLRPGTGEPDWAGVRVLLVADLLARAAELRGVQVLTAAVFPGAPPADQVYAERAAGLLGVHPVAARASSAEASSLLGGLADVHIAAAGSAADELSGVVTRAGAVRLRTTDSRPGSTAVAGPIPGGADPLAVRLALLSYPHGQAVDLDDGVLTRACELTARWRIQVAYWAESPSRPMPRHVAAALGAAFGDLDTARVLQLLTELPQQSDVPDGARFETFVYADRVLGLELAREIGRPRG